MSRFDGVVFPWYAVQTQPRREPVAESSIRSFCEATFCPRYRERVILHGYRREVTRPLFPGYLFAAFDRGASFRAVHYAHGVRGVVSVGGEAATVPVELLQAIERRMRDGYVVLEKPPLAVGQRVQVFSGPLAGFTGIFDGRISGKERVAVLLDNLKFNARAIVERDALRPIG